MAKLDNLEEQIALEEAKANKIDNRNQRIKAFFRVVMLKRYYNINEGRAYQPNELREFYEGNGFEMRGQI